ncbi:MAG: hypothetical protein M1347_06200 [Chloroflexi bacterium]|nr:hypothetical protein [Chloroflexota bacterium]
MDEFDFKEEKTKKPRRFGAALWNCGSLVFFLGALAAAAFFILLFLNPFSEFNPFPPAPATEIPSSTPTLADATNTPTETATATPEPSTATPTVDEAGGFFQIQEGSPAAIDSTVFHPELACNFMGVAGQAFSLDATPITGLQVHVAGTLDDQPVDKIGLTGAAPQYGSGAYYEIQLANQPIASENALQITLLNASGAPISDPFSFSTTASCQENLLLINFSEMP